MRMGWIDPRYCRQLTGCLIPLWCSRMGITIIPTKATNGLFGSRISRHRITVLRRYIVPALWDANATCSICKCARRRGTTSIQVVTRWASGTSVKYPIPGLDVDESVSPSRSSNSNAREPYLSTIRTRTPSFSAIACIHTLK